MDLNSFDFAGKEKEENLMDTVIKDETVERLARVAKLDGSKNPEAMRKAILSLKGNTVADITTLGITIVEALPAIAVGALQRYADEAYKRKKKEELAIYTIIKLGKKLGMSDEEVKKAWKEAEERAELKRRERNN